ncbi:extracellular solute-binding protein [Plantactinospora sp. B5E13]|uniref:ABC transporter substrate-binding protein n=1 Tax=Plantactinospora sp. B5E13 TaxID=3153758 RepID=UPI00325DDD67
MVDETGSTDDRRLAEELAATLSEAQAALPAAGPETLTVIRRRYRRGQRRRAGLASVAAAVLVLAVTLTGTQLIRGGGLGAPPANDGDATIRVWAITPPVRDSALQELVERYGEETGVRVELTLYGNEEYKQRLRGVGEDPAGPDVFVSWGGAELARLARTGRLLDLTGPLRERPGVAERFLPDVLAGGAVDGRQYGLPMSGTHPVVLFYNRDVFARADLRPPRTYAELLQLVDRFSANGTIPLTLGGAQGWTELMYVMYLAERIGGPGTTADVAAGRPDAWTKPAVLQALREARDLAERGAFGADFASIGYDDGTAGRRLASGEAAMQLMGTWEYPTQLGRDSDFVLDGRLGWVPFPAVAGGVGDPADLVGVPAQYFSVAGHSRHRAAAVDFVRAVAGDAYLDDLVADGEVPPVVDAATRLRGSTHAEFTTSISELVARAPSYGLAWDQAVDPETASKLNTNLRRLFRSELTAEQFAALMSN